MRGRKTAWRKKRQENMWDRMEGEAGRETREQ